MTRHGGRDELGFAYFDWLTAVDQLDAADDPASTSSRTCGRSTAASTCCCAPGCRPTTPTLATATGVFAGAAWHERETFEMFGLDFDGHPHLVPLLLPDGFEGHPLRKDFVLAARAAKAWPGAKEPGESDARRGSPPAGARPGRPACPTRTGAATAWRPAVTDVLEVALRLVLVLVAFLTLPLLVGQTEHKAMAHMQSPARPDVRRRLPRLGAAGRRRREVRAEGGHRPGRRRPHACSSSRRPSR